MSQSRQRLNHPSRTRLHRDLAAGKANRDARIARFEPQDPNETRHNPSPAEQASRRANWQIVKYLGYAGAATLVALVLRQGGGGDVAPVDVSKLPQDEVTRIHVPAGGSHYPSGIAGMVKDQESDLQQVTDEIRGQLEGAKVVPTGTVIELPTDQLDPLAVERYETGR